MNGYYRRKPDLPLEEVKTLTLNEIEFVTDLGETYRSREPPKRLQCPRCEEKIYFIESQPICPNCFWDSTEEITEKANH